MHLSDRFVIQHQHMLHIVRIVVACTIALAVTRIFDFPHSNWALISIIVVMGPMSYSGSVVSKANQRLVGTVIGASLGLALYLLPPEYIVMHDTFLLLILAISMYAVKGKNSYAAVLVALTLFLVAGSGGEDAGVATWRAVNVIWGSTLSIICSRYLFPSRALIHFQLLVIEFLELCSENYLMHIKSIHGDEQTNKYSLKQLSVNLAKQRALKSSIYDEWKGDEQDITDILMIERRVLSVLETLITREWGGEHALDTIKKDPLLFVRSVELYKQASTMSAQIDTGKVEQLSNADIHLLAFTEDTFNLFDNGQNMDNFHLFGYLWLNHELAHHISSISFSLNKVFNHKQFKAAQMTKPKTS